MKVDGVAAGVADQHPAGRLLADAVTGHMRLGLGAVDESEIAEIAAAADVDSSAMRLAMDDALERHELRPGEEMIEAPARRAQPFRHFRVARAGLVADAGDEAARGLLAEALDQFLPKRAQRGHMHQHHALVVEPDAALVGSEAQAVGEVVDCRNDNRARTVGPRRRRRPLRLQRRLACPMDVNVHPSLPHRRFFSAPDDEATVRRAARRVNLIIDILV